MTKAEYLEELRTGLEERFTPGETADILDEYAGFFDSGREEGRTEEDVAAGLGSPAALVRMLAAERPPRPEPEACRLPPRRPSYRRGPVSQSDWEPCALTGWWCFS